MTDAATWDAYAEAFDDEADHGLRDPAVRAAWHGLLAEHLPAGPCDIADLGCGTGSLSSLGLELGHRVTGVDFAPRMLAVARAKCPGATFRHGDAGTPPLAARSYDVVLARHVLWTLAPLPDVLQRWVALLRPSGPRRLVLIEGVWETGSGLTADDLSAALEPFTEGLEVVPLGDPALWGGPIRDIRYAVVATARVP